MYQKFNLFFILFIFGCTGLNKPKDSDPTKKPYLLVISIDGYRWDYTDRYRPKFLTQFRKNGVSLNSLRPSYPTDTFPNHLTLMTGLYPDNHGIVANSFYSPTLKKIYSLNDRSSQADGSFYRGKTLWGVAAENGMKTGVMFWPGSEAEIRGHRSHYYHPYDPNISPEKRVDTVLSWLRLPSESRPHVISMYFGEVDSAGHKYGPDSKEVRATIQKIDEVLDHLMEQTADLDFKIDVIILSDHGMAKLGPHQDEKLAQTPFLAEQMKSFTIFEQGAHIHLYKRDNAKLDLVKIRNDLNQSARHFQCHLSGESLKNLNYGHNKRVGDIFCMAERGWTISHSKIKSAKGGHGWSQYEGMDMHGIFYASGPSFKKNIQLETMDNIHIFPLMIKLLNLRFSEKIDGDINTADLFLR